MVLLGKRCASALIWPSACCRQMRSMATIDVGNVSSLVSAFKLISSSLGSAFYATGCGIVGSIGVIVMVANLDYFIDRDEVVQ